MFPEVKPYIMKKPPPKINLNKHHKAATGLHSNDMLMTF